MKPDLDLIVIAGSPGAGKSTLCCELRTLWNVVPIIELSDLRNLHLNRGWSNQSEDDRAIAFDHLVHIVHSYAKHKWRPVLVTDLREEWVSRVDEVFADLGYAIITLFGSDAVIRDRVGAGRRASRISMPPLNGIALCKGGNFLPMSTESRVLAALRK